jgi:hypothetical protein
MCKTRVLIPTVKAGGDSKNRTILVLPVFGDFVNVKSIPYFVQLLVGIKSAKVDIVCEEMNLRDSIASNRKPHGAKFFTAWDGYNPDLPTPDIGFLYPFNVQSLILGARAKKQVTFLALV